MKNAWTKIKNWFKKNWAIVAAAVGGFITALCCGLCSGRNKRLDSDTKLCKDAGDRVAEATKHVESATSRLDAAEDISGKLEQRIESSKTGVNDCSDRVEQLIRNTQDIAAVISKYDTGTKSTTKKE